MAYEPGKPSIGTFNDHSARHEAGGADTVLTIFNDNGTLRNLRPMRGTVVGPASYAAGGLPVDLSATFSSIVLVVAARFFTTATGAAALGQIIVPSETGTDVYSSAKFRVVVLRTAGHTHTYDKADTPTDGANSGIAGADPHTHGLAFTSTASGAASNSNLSEATPTSNFSANTMELLVWGVPV